LSKLIIPYLDRHLAFSLLAHLVETALFLVEELPTPQYELAKGTNMVDYAVSLFEQLNPDKKVSPGVISRYVSKERIFSVDLKTTGFGRKRENAYRKLRQC